MHLHTLFHDKAEVTKKLQNVKKDSYSSQTGSIRSYSRFCFYDIENYR